MIQLDGLHLPVGFPPILCLFEDTYEPIVATSDKAL